MAQITYTKLPVGLVRDLVKVTDQLGRVTTFGDSFAYSCFVDGLARAQKNGVTVTLVDSDGTVLVGTVEQLDTVEESPEASAKRSREHPLHPDNR